MTTLKDLGLSYEAAAHGVQTAIKYDMDQKGVRTEHFPGRELKHHRTGIDCRAADALGLAQLLMDKGVFTGEEYMEYMRLAMNTELDRYEKEMRHKYNLPIVMSFR